MSEADRRGGTIETESLTLVEPNTYLQEPWKAMFDAYNEAGEGYRLGGSEIARHDFSGYIAYLHGLAEENNQPPGFVPETVYWLVRGGEELVGESSIRHRLNANLMHEGGHIGYQIRPDRRRLGYGTRILSLTLIRAADMGMHRVLVTCDTDNIGSARIIERNGGILENCVIAKRTGKEKARYWIDIP